MVNVIEEALNVRLDHIVVTPELELDRQFVYGIQCSYIRTVTITTAHEILLVDRLQDALYSRL